MPSSESCFTFDLIVSASRWSSILKQWLSGREWMPEPVRIIGRFALNSSSQKGWTPSARSEIVSGDAPKWFVLYPKFIFKPTMPTRAFCWWTACWRRRLSRGPSKRGLTPTRTMQSACSTPLYNLLKKVELIVGKGAICGKFSSVANSSSSDYESQCSHRNTLPCSNAPNQEYWASHA